MSQGFSVHIPGPFTLQCTFILRKDNREEVGNLLSKESQQLTARFDTIHDALAALGAVADTLQTRETHSEDK